MNKGGELNAKLDLQIKSKKRVTEHGEVFTNEKEVKAMVDLVDDEIKGIYSKGINWPAKWG